MALRLSTGLRDAMMDFRAGVVNTLYHASSIALVDSGTTAVDSITDTEEALGTFIVGDKITVSLATNGADNITAEILSVAIGTITIATGSFTAGQGAGAPIMLASARGGSFADLFREGNLHIYTGTQPTSANDVESGSKLVEITQGSAAFTPGTFANGLNFGAVVAGVIAKETGEVWSGEASATGTAGWFRFYANDEGTGADSSKIRFDGAIATSGAQLNMSNTAITSGGTTTVDTVAITLPANA